MSNCVPHVHPCTQENGNDTATAVKEKVEKEGNKNTDTPKGEFPRLVHNGKIADDVQMRIKEKKVSTEEGKGRSRNVK